MIKYIRKSAKDQVNRELSVFQPGSWVYVENPTDEELSQLVDRFDLEIGHLHDALDPNEVPRHEEEGETVYIFTRTPVPSANTYITSPVLFIIHPKSIITVAKLQVPVFEPFLTGRKNIQTTNRVRLFIKFFNELISLYNSTITRINKQAAAATVNLDNIQNRDIVALVVLEQMLNEFLNAVVQTNSFLQVLAANKKLFAQEADRDLIEDVFLASGQLISLSKSSLKQVKNIRDVYSTIMTNNLNRVIKFFTALTIVLTIPMIVASFYGMNVNLPLDDHPMAFGIILVSTMLVITSVLYFFQKRQWL